MKRLLSVLLTVIVIVIGNYVIVAQGTVSGEWRAEYDRETPDKVHLSFSRKSGRGKNQMGSSYDLKDLSGLSTSQISGPNSVVRFSIVREAGTIDCEGTFGNDKGSGTFRFTPSGEFVTAMRARGFDLEKREPKYNDDEPSNRLFAAATLNVTVALADDLVGSGFGKLEVEDLFKATIFKIDGRFAREMKESGFQNLTFDDLVKARIFKIDAEFVREAARMGFEKEPFESLVKMRIFKISPEFVAGLRAEGLADLDIEDVVKLRIFNIDAEFIRKARAEGVPVEVEKLVQKKLGVLR
jgi:hypothetical protein